MLRLMTISAVALAVAAPVSAATIVAYDTVVGTTIAASLTPDDVTGADLVRGDGVEETGLTTGDFRTNRWTLGGDLDEAIENNDYLEWGFSSTETYSLDTLSLNYGRGREGAKQIAILASFDDGEFSQIFLDTSVDTGSNIANIDLDGLDVSTATFRLFGWDASRNGGGLLIRNSGVGEGGDFGISLTGAIAAVPLPAGLPLMAGALALLGLTRRKG